MHFNATQPSQMVTQAVADRLYKRASRARDGDGVRKEIGFPWNAASRAVHEDRPYHFKNLSTAARYKGNTPCAMCVTSRNRWVGRDCTCAVKFASSTIVDALYSFVKNVRCSSNPVLSPVDPHDQRLLKEVMEKLSQPRAL